MSPQQEPSLKEISVPVPALEASALGSELGAIFDQHPEAPGAVLTHEGKFAAALSREEFFDAMAHPLGAELYARRPLSALVERPSFRPMRALRGSLSVSEAFAKVLGNPGPILVQGGEPAMVSFEALANAALCTLRQTRETLEAEAGRRAQLEKEVEQARQETSDIRRSKNEFLSNVSHEIRTPMNGVMGMTGLLLESGLPPKEREYTRTIQKSAGHLLEILNKFLDFSKAEAHVLTLDSVDFNLLEVVESVTEKYGPQMGAKGVELAEFVASTVPQYLRGDPLRLGQILDHLVGNAVKFTDSGEVVVTVSREEETEIGVLLRFEIRDTGPGIDPEARETIFEPFRRRVDPTHENGGAGLGLAISKELARLMDGQIGVQSAPGGGSLFWFTARFEKQTSVPESVTAPAMDLCGLRALIVDDNPTNRHILHCQLSAWRMVPTCVGSAKEALATLKKALDGKPFDIALLDMQMPETNGLALARAIKGDASMAGLRLIILTSLGQIPQQELRTAGVAACMVKPVKQSLLYQQIASVIAQPVAMPQPPEVSEPSPMKPSRILVAEDNLINQMVTMGQLEKLGYHGDLAVNGLEVLAALRKAPYSIILMDCQMPLMDGYEATRRIRANQELTLQPRIIAVTAHAMAGDSAKCLAAGMDDYISKPVKLEDLAAKIAHWEATPYGSEPPAPAAEPALPAPASTDPNQPPALAPDRLEILKNLDPESGTAFYRKLLETFAQSAEKDFAELRGYVVAGAWGSVKPKAHSLKGSSRNMGADAMGNICQEIEALSFDPGKPEAMQNALERLAAEFGRVCEAIRQELAAL